MVKSTQVGQRLGVRAAILIRPVVLMLVTSEPMSDRSCAELNTNNSGSFRATAFCRAKVRSPPCSLGRATILASAARRNMTVAFVRSIVFVQRLSGTARHGTGACDCTDDSAQGSSTDGHQNHGNSQPERQILTKVDCFSHTL